MAMARRGDPTYEEFRRHLPPSRTLLDELNSRVESDHLYMMLYGTNVEAQPLRYFYLIHAFEVLVVGKCRLGMDSINTRTLRQITVPSNWHFEDWHREMEELHECHPPDALSSVVENHIDAMMTCEDTKPHAPYGVKKTLEDVFFFMMLVFIDDLYQHWVSGTPRVLDSVNLHSFLFVDTPSCLSVKTLIALMLYGRSAGSYLQHTLDPLRGISDHPDSPPEARLDDPTAMLYSSTDYYGSHVTDEDPFADLDAHDDEGAPYSSHGGTHPPPRHSHNSSLPHIFPVGGTSNRGVKSESAWPSGPAASDPRPRLASIVHSELVTMDVVAYHIQTMYPEVVGCIAATARVVECKQRETREKKREMQQRLVRRMCHLSA